MLFPFIGIEINGNPEWKIRFMGVCGKYLPTHTNSTIFETSLKVN